MIENPVTDEKLLLMGYNPSTSLPIEHVPYEIPQGTKILTIDVPDRMIESPLSHHDVASSILMLNPDEAQRKALMEMGEDTCLFLRGAQSGRTYLAAKPALLSSDKIKPSHYFHEVYDAARHRYVDSGTKPPTADQFIPIAVEALAPVPSTIDPAVQTIKIPRWEDFMATVSPTLGYRETPLTGLVIKHEGDEALPGRPVRLQGMIGDDHKPGQTESGWEVAATITDVQTMTLLSAKERIAAGLKQMKIAGALHFDSVEAMRAALANNSLTDDDIEKAGVKKLHSRNDLQQLLQEASFTPSDALHYGYVSLTDMRTKLTNLFVDKELNANRDDNLIHFVDLDPAKKKMIWHHPTKRAMVRLADDVAAQFEAATQEPGPDASNVHGAPDIERGLSAGGLERN